MALFKEKLHSCRAAAITAADTPDEIQEKKNSKVQARVNRLKRPKKTADTKHELCPEVTASYQKCCPSEQTSTKTVHERKLGQTLSEDSGRYSLAKGTIPSERPSKQSKGSCVLLNKAGSCLSSADPELDVIDLCGDEENNLHMLPTDRHVKKQYEHTDSPQATKMDMMMTRKSEDDFQKLLHTFPQTVHCHSFKSVTNIKSQRKMRLGWREDFSDKTREELLEQIQAQNRRFAVHQFFSLLLKRRSEFKKSLTGHGMITHIPGVPVFRKKKQDVDVLCDDQTLKRQRCSEELGQDKVCVSASDCVNSSHSKASSRSRLSVSRRRKQQNPAPSALLPPGQSVCSTGEKTPLECVTREEEVLWTEKYQPQHSDGIIGNSASVRKLHSWLKEWRMRADVEERKRRREEWRRMQAENRESWDCGDFEGESVMVEGEVELCNTVLIVGPAGVGKTAAVYACAEELGYKVFEVNSSSLRSGQLVLSQLREATQSHQVGAFRPDSPKPHSSLTTETLRPRAPRAAPAAAPPATLKEELSRKAMASSKKSSRSIPRNKSSAPAVTIKHFFKRTDRPVNKITDLHQYDQAADSVKPDGLIECDSNAEASTDDQILNTEDPQLNRRTQTSPPISLILFEEVDIIFSEDVGFLTAIKTLMTTTKRPIILTTNDSLFSKTFNGHFEKINFKTPSVEIARSYLQCVCVVENVLPDPEDLSFLLEECKGDVRRSVLELELWACSGGGQTQRHTLNKTLACGSWAELDSSECVDVLVENWRIGRSLFYSNLELLFTSHFRSSQNIDKKHRFSADKSIKFVKMLEYDDASSSSVLKQSKTLSRLKGRKLLAGDELKRTHQSSLKCFHNLFDRFNQSTRIDQSESISAEESMSKLVSCCLDSLAHFFDTMSFLDSCIYKQLLQVPGQCQPGPLGWIGAQLTDSLVDELREEEVNTHLERSYEFLSVLEGLGFHQCRAELSEARSTLEKLKAGIRGERFTKLTDELISESSDAFVSQNKPSVVQRRRREVLNKLLSSKAFSCHGNKRAVAVEYLPALRSICRSESVKQQNRPRFIHYLSEIRLPLHKSVFQLLASDQH